MKNKLFIFYLAAFVVMFNFCKKDDSNSGNETKTSANFNTESHNMGQNCMNCHTQGGSGEGWFNLAGTVYNESFTNTEPNKTINLYTEPNGKGDLKYSIQVDGNGNFYSAQSINFGSGLYPAVVGNTVTKYMSSSITSGKCNSCHGVSNDKIWTK